MKCCRQATAALAGAGNRERSRTGKNNASRQVQRIPCKANAIFLGGFRRKLTTTNDTSTRSRSRCTLTGYGQSLCARSAFSMDTVALLEPRPAIPT